MAAGWDGYVKNILDSDPCIKKCAIVGVPDGSLWTKSKPPLGEDFGLTAPEIQRLGSMWAKIDDVPAQGLHAEGAKYVVPLVEPEFVIGKNQADKSLGLVAVKTNKACLVAQFTGERENGVKCRTALERIATYLKGMNY